MIGTIRISQLPPANTLDGSENLIVNQGGNTRLTTVNGVVNLATVGLASVSYVNNLVGVSTSGLASTSYVDSKVGLSTSGLLSSSGSGVNLTGIVTSIVAGSNISISGSTGRVTIGTTAPGVPTGGTTGQVLTKSSGTDYDAAFADLPARTTSAAGIVPATSFAAITYAATVDLDMASLDSQYRTISLTGDLTFTTSNRATGRTVVLRLVADGTQRTLTFPGGWVFVGTKPANIAASKTGILSLSFFGTADTDCIAAWGVQA